MRQGFTLIEISIVLVIIGLLVGGIIAGRSMLRSSQVQNVVVDVNRYIKAFNAFQDKYNALPGDMVNATSYWGTASGGCPNGSGTGTQTCNGDGNGHISDAGTSSTFGEQFRAWQQLANAGFIAGSFTGYAGGATDDTCVTGSNCPTAPVAGGLYQIYNADYYDNGSDSRYFAAQYRHVIGVGAATGDESPKSPVLTAAEAYAVDQKTDDGLPGTGAILSYKSTAAATPNCTTSASATTATYNLAGSGLACALIFETGF